MAAEPSPRTPTPGESEVPPSDPPAVPTAARRPGWRTRLNERALEWARRRHGPDVGTVTISRRRIYILPTRLGLVYGGMLFAMLLAGLNYGNNLALVLAFVLAGGAWVAMLECHRNLAGVAVIPAGTRAPFAGDPAEFGFRLDAERPRHDLVLRAGAHASGAGGIPADGDLATAVLVPTERRGRVRLERLRVESTFPLGLFTAWTWLHPGLHTVVYPRPAPRGIEGPPPAAEAGAAQDGRARGEEDFAGLRDFRSGDPPRRIAWKAYARSGTLVVKEYVGSARAPVIFDLDAVPGRDLEARLRRLARWIVDAEERGERYGVRLGEVLVLPGTGLPHRNRCLARLAGWRLGEAP